MKDRAASQHFGKKRREEHTKQREQQDRPNNYSKRKRCFTIEVDGVDHEERELLLGAQQQVISSVACTTKQDLEQASREADRREHDITTETAGKQQSFDRNSQYQIV